MNICLFHPLCSIVLNRPSELVAVADLVAVACTGGFHGGGFGSGTRKRQITIPMAQAIIRALAVNAARGQHRAQQLFAELLSETERANKAANDKWVQVAMEYKHNWEQELERRARLGLSGPEPFPHPDDIIIDRKTDQVIINGPMTKEEKIEWDKMYARIEECDREIERLSARLADRKNKRYRHILEDDIAHERRIRAIIVEAVGEPKNRNRR